MPRCLSFMYSMYGKDVGAFNIYREGQGVAKTAVFRKSGDKGQDWKFGEVTIQPATDLKVTNCFIGHTKLNFVDFMF